MFKISLLRAIVEVKRVISTSIIFKVRIGNIRLRWFQIDFLKSVARFIFIEKKVR